MRKPWLLFLIVFASIAATGIAEGWLGHAATVHLTRFDARTVSQPAAAYSGPRPVRALVLAPASPSPAVTSPATPVAPATYPYPQDGGIDLSTLFASVVAVLLIGAAAAILVRRRA